MGGRAGTVEPERVATTVGCDHLVLGAGEESLPQLIARIEAGEIIPRIVGSDEKGTPFRIALPDDLPAPMLHRWVENFTPYLRGDAGYPVQTKRGCPLKCTYCTYGRIEGVRYRFLNPKTIADEIEGAVAAARHEPESLGAIHPGGRAILDAVQSACALSREQLAPARHVLANYGNMSSASVLFVFAELLHQPASTRQLPGAAMAFGLGLTLEALEFTRVAAPASQFSPHEQVNAGLCCEPSYA